jgi:hypothetical protein
MWEKLLIRLAALYWAIGVFFLFLAGSMFKEFVRKKRSGRKRAPLQYGLHSSPNHKGGGRFNALIRLHGRN